MIELVIAGPPLSPSRTINKGKKHDRVTDFQDEANRQGRKCAELYEVHLDMLNHELPHPYTEYYQVEKAEMVEVLFNCLGSIMALLGVAPARESMPKEVIVDLERHVTREFAMCVLERHHNEDGTVMTPEQCAQKVKRGGFEPDTDAYLYKEEEDNQSDVASSPGIIKFKGGAWNGALDRLGHVFNSIITNHRDAGGKFRRKPISSPAGSPGGIGAMRVPLPRLTGY